MKQIILLCSAFCIGHMAFSQNLQTTSTIKWAPTSLITGSINLQGEYYLGQKNSLTANIGIPVNVHHTISYDGKEADFKAKTTSFLAGYRRYLSKKGVSGMYVEPFINYVHQTGSGTGRTVYNRKPRVTTFTNQFNSFGIGAQLGAQYIVSKRMIINLFLVGPEINAARDHYKSVEISRTLPWTVKQVYKAQKNATDFINKLPFTGDNVVVSADRNTRSVTADFQGVLPGFRTGVSVGIAL